MPRNNLKYFRLKLASIIGIFLAISTIISAMLVVYVFIQNRKIGVETFKSRVVAANNILQANLYSQINIIFNNSEFISYLFSGELSRQRHYGDILWLLNNLDYNLIQGIEVFRYNTYTKDKQIVFSHGTKTLYHVSLEMCYLNNKLNFLMGDCVYKHFSLVLYFDPNVYLSSLHQLDNRINKPETNKYPIFYFIPFGQKFAGLHAEAYSILPIPIEISRNNKLENTFAMIAILLLLIFIGTYFFSLRILSRLVNQELVAPLKNMINALHKSENLPENKNNIDELNELIHIVNSYNETQLNIRLNEIYKRVIHDIRSPLFAINSSIGEVFEINNPVRKSIKSAVHNTLAIINNVLRSNNSEANMILDMQEHKVFISIFDIMDEIIALKQVEWKREKDKFNLVLNYENIENYWLFTHAIEFKRHISNLLNNSLQAMQNECINILINVTEKEGVLIIEIKDDGVGIEDESIPKVTSGISLSGGNGIGLKNAKSFFSEDSCSFEINSKKNLGTKINININTVPSPTWFTEILELNTVLIVVDDDNSILQYWKQKFSNFELQILTFNTPDLFLEWFRANNILNNHTFFIDYDYHHQITGIDILAEIGNKYDSYLITSNYYDSELQFLVNDCSYIKMIPKSLLSEITIVLK